MKRRIMLASTLAAFGCATSGPRPSGEDATQRPATIFAGPEVHTVLADRPRASSRTFEAQPTVLWAAVKAVYADYGIPLTLDNPTTHQLGNSDFYRTRTFAGRPMTDLVSCGSGITGPNAASYRIYMSLVATVDGLAKAGTMVSVTLTASARDMVGGASGDRLPCGSSGELERLFLARVGARMGGS